MLGIFIQDTHTVKLKTDIDHLGSEHFQADSNVTEEHRTSGILLECFHTVQDTHEDECCREPRCCG